MPKKPSSKFGRLTLLFLAAWGGLGVIAIVAFLAVESAGPIHAALWHMRHGSTVTFDGHTFHLPLSWYPDPENRPGQFALQHTQFASVDVSRITLATEPRTLNDQAALHDIAAMSANLNRDEPTPSARWTTETLRSRTLTLQCTASTNNGVGETLICQAAGSNLRILALTMGLSAHTQALDIIETSE